MNSFIRRTLVIGIASLSVFVPFRPATAATVCQEIATKIAAKQQKVNELLLLIAQFRNSINALTSRVSKEQAQRASLAVQYKTETDRWQKQAIYNDIKSLDIEISKDKAIIQNQNRLVRNYMEELNNAMNKLGSLYRESARIGCPQ